MILQPEKMSEQFKWIKIKLLIDEKPICLIQKDSSSKNILYFFW